MPSGHLSVLDVDDGMFQVIACQIVDDNLTALAELGRQAPCDVLEILKHHAIHIKPPFPSECMAFQIPVCVQSAGFAAIFIIP